MSNILTIESSASLCSLALAMDEKVCSREQLGQRSHTQFMLSFIDELLNDMQISISDLDAIAFSAGPGSFTGIRLAASTAKALAFTAGIPVIAVSSLAVIAQGFYRQTSKTTPSTIITDARMDELYIGQYNYCDGLATAVSPDTLIKVLDADTLASKNSIIGDAQPLLENMSAFADANFIDIKAHALDVLPLAQKLLADGNVANAIDAEAIYLRGKSGWKTTKQQLAEKSKNNK